jgi:hypothetical protein
VSAIRCMTEQPQQSSATLSLYCCCPRIGIILAISHRIARSLAYFLVSVAPRTPSLRARIEQHCPPCTPMRRTPPWLRRIAGAIVCNSYCIMHSRRIIHRRTPSFRHDDRRGDAARIIPHTEMIGTLEISAMRFALQLSRSHESNANDVHDRAAQCRFARSWRVIQQNRSTIHCMRVCTNRGVVQ